MAKHNQAWHSEDATGGIAYRTPSLTNMIKENQARDQVIAGLATNISVLTKMFTESQTKKVNIVEDVQPTLNEDYEEANYVNNSQGGYQSQQYQGQGQQNQWRPNPQGQGNQQWRNDQDSSNQGNWSNNNNNFSNRSSNPYVPPKGQYSNQGSSSNSKLENMLERVLQNQERADTSMRNMTELVGSHTASIQKLEMQMRDLSREQNPKQKGTLPSDTIANPKGSGSGQTSHCMEITTRSGKVLQGESEQVVEVEESKQEVEAQVEAPIVVEAKKGPEKVESSRSEPEEVKEKKEDPGERDFARALCDNGASINLMPLSIYKQAGLGMPRPTSMRLQMADRSIKRHVGIVDDLLVKVGKFHLPANFVILDGEVDKEISIILGKIFLATGRALMDSEWNEIKFRINDEEVTFQESKGMKLPHEYESISVIDVVDEVEDAVEMKMEEQCLGEALAAILVNFDGEDMEGYMESINALEGLGSYNYAPKKLSLNLENRVEQPLTVLREHTQATVDNSGHLRDSRWNLQTQDKIGE
ncbi:PREDICTED: eukaryotic peptide chain release factor GTP-binding subunit-like [Nicotiana attenuata]|nr:PREDICTED: eukaryotic peptide chain release factor GTP-binding subunit-like [Nicotiana attenuata]